MVVLDIDDAEKTCTCCNKPLKAFGHESSRKLDIVPVQVKVIEFQCLKYAGEDECSVKTAPTPKMPIPKNFSTPGLLAWVIVSNTVMLFRYTDKNLSSTAWVWRSVVRPWRNG